MCTVSKIMDHFEPLIPKPDFWVPQPLIPEPPSLKEIQKAEKIINDYHKALEAAKIVDKLTDQPDCEDPEKIKLEQRVANLEKAIKQLKRTISNLTNKKPKKLSKKEKRRVANLNSGKTYS